MRNISLLTVLFLFGLSNLSYTQKATKDSEKVIIEFGKNKITSSELVRAFKKNMNRTNDNLFKLSKDSISDFLNLYTNFRLKVTDAIDRGFLNDSTVKAELQQNRKILAESFYFEKKLVEPNVTYMTNLRNKEYLFAIILANIKQTATTIDTVDAYKKISNALKRINDGESFEQVAKELSDDYETGKNGGLVQQYITSGKMQRPLENAIFNTKPGNVYPEIVKTNYGYFLVKVIKETPRKYVRSRHILISITEDLDSLNAYKKADSLLKLLKKGADFAKLAKENSDDVTTAVNGGDLGAYYSRSTGMENSSYTLVSEFENAIFDLKDGDISGVIKSNFGFHIARRDSSKDPDYKTEYEELKKLYKRLYFKVDQTKLIDSLLNVTKFKLYDDVLHQFSSFLDSNGTNIADNWDKNVTDLVKKYILYEHLGKKNNVESFIDVLHNEQKLRGTALTPIGIRKAIETYIEPDAIFEVTKNLETEYHEFDNLMREFRDGILLFKVEAQEVWDKMKFDSTLARHYFDSTKIKYYTEDAFDVSEIYFLDKQTADSVYKRILAGEDFDEIASKETQRSGYREKKGNWGKVYVRTNSLAREAKDKNASKGQILEPFLNEPGYSIIRVNDSFSPRLKTFEESIPDFSAQYQEYMQQRLSKQWLDRIKKKYPVKINDKELSKLINENK